MSLLLRCKMSRKAGERDRFGKILPNCQFNTKKLNTWKPAMMADLAILANVTNLAKFCQSQCKEAKHIEASHDGRFDDFSKRNCQVNAKKLNT